ncbi:MAG: hypothetical protein P4N59_03225 [Negativicutes bacterium]|nr:hypothetical protein [Negativicutes bacterium]
MDLKAALADLSADQIAEVKAYEQQLTQKYGNNVILLAFNKK